MEEEYSGRIIELEYSKTEPESKGFKFEGQQAIDFKAKLGEDPEYDEEGNVIPIEFSTESLCVFSQSGDVPDDAEFITTVDNIKTVEALGNDFWNFDIIYRGEEYNEVKIPAFVLKSKENMSLDTATQLQGYLWWICRFLSYVRYKAWTVLKRGGCWFST